jgi:hypothetical protein
VAFLFQIRVGFLTYERKTNMPTIKMSLTIDKNVALKLRTAANRFGIARSRIASELLRAGLPSLETATHFDATTRFVAASNGKDEK